MREETVEGAFARLAKRVSELEASSKTHSESPPVSYSATPVAQAVTFGEDSDGFGD